MLTDHRQRASWSHVFERLLWLQMERQTMDSQERSVAIRSLLVSTARETPEEALSKAISDIERYRRLHSSK